MCDKAVRKDLFSFQCVPDWFVTQQQVKTWHDDDDRLILDDEDGYKKRKAQKAQIEKALMLIACHPSRWGDWCMSEDEKKKRQKNCGSKR